MKVIVIGSGMAGLTAAAYMAQAGNEVTVYEQFPSVGGVTATYSSNGFSWDLGPLMLEKFEPGEAANSILKELGILGCLQFVRDDRGMTFLDFELWKSEDYQGPYWRRERLKELFPEDAAGLDEYYRFYDTMMKLSYLMRRPEQSLFTKLKMLFAFQKVKKMSEWSADKLTKHYFKDQRLRAVFMGILADFCVAPSEFPGLGLPLCNLETAFEKRIPLDAKGVKLMGYSYIIGGCGKLAEAMADKIAACGGKIITSTAVEKILVSDGKAAGVLLSDGRTEAADLVFASGGAKETFYKLVGKEHLNDGFIQKIEAVQPMDSVFMVHLGVDFDPMCFQKAALCYYYKTYDIEEAVLRCREGIYHEGSDGFLIYIPSAYSPQMAREGHHAVTLYTIAPNVLKDGDWQDKSAYFADRLIDEAEAYLPGLKEHIVQKAVMTPPDFRARTHLDHHAFGGLAPVMGKPGIPHITPVKGLYFMGAQSESGGGVAGVMIGAQNVCSQVLKN